MSKQNINLEMARLCANTLRLLAVDGVQKANSGHPGMPMGMADVATILWSKYLEHNPGDPQWVNRDRFILSAGHGSMLLYSLLHLSGYDVTLEDLQQFRQWDSRTPGHPEYKCLPGVETTTGPLGQGLPPVSEWQSPTKLPQAASIRINFKFSERIKSMELSVTAI